jgi:DnaJ-class molecular chaperone
VTTTQPTDLELQAWLTGTRQTGCQTCGGEGVIDGLIINDRPATIERCHQCKGTGQ